MKATLVVVAALLVAAAGCGETRTVTKTVPVTVAKPGVGPPRERAEFGYVKSLERSGTGWVMRFDPAWFLTGVTANVAAAEDGVVRPGEPVPNDNYVLDEGRRLLTYRVAANARVTVLKKGVTGSPISVARLAQLVAGKNPFGRPLFEPLRTGFWILVDIDTVRSLDQQYRP